MTFKQPSWLNCCTEGNYANRSLTGFCIVAAVDVTVGVEKRIANLVLLGTERYLHFEMGYEVNGTKLHNINKKFAAAEIQFQDIGIGLSCMFFPYTMMV